jgi:hypothetical protein
MEESKPESPVTSGQSEVPHHGRTDPVAPSDEDLAVRYAGDPRSPEGRAAVEALFSRYDTRVYHWCMRLARNHETALDLAREAMLTALRDLAGDRPAGRARDRGIGTRASSGAIARGSRAPESQGV